MDYLKIYNIIGKIICSLAGGLIGFILAGSIAAVAGILLGLVVSHMLEKSVLRPKKRHL